MQGAAGSGSPVRAFGNHLSLLLLAPLLYSQMAPPNAAGIRMGHIHLNVSDVAAQTKFWVEQFDARPITKSGIEGVVVPGLMILFNRQAPSQGSEGTVLDHFGFKVQSRDGMVDRARVAGFAVPREFKGSEGYPNAYITGPDGVKVEVQEDAALGRRVVAQHFHFLLPEPLPLRAWYIEQFSLAPTTRGPYQTADLPAMNLTFAPSKAPAGRNMRGGILDHLGFEVRGLQALCRKLEAQGVQFETQYHQIPGTGVASAMLMDPSGVYLELTEGLDAYDPFATEETSGSRNTSKQ